MMYSNSVPWTNDYVDCREYFGNLFLALLQYSMLSFNMIKQILGIIEITIVLHAYENEIPDEAAGVTVRALLKGDLPLIILLNSFNCLQENIN